MTFQIGERVQDSKGQRLTGTVVRVWQDIHGHCYKVALDIGGSGSYGVYYGKDLMPEQLPPPPAEIKVED